MWSNNGCQRKGVNKVANLSRERPLNMTEYICKQDAVDAIHEFPMFMECNEIYIYQKRIEKNTCCRCFSGGTWEVDKALSGTDK